MGGVSGEKIADLGPWLILGAIVGARMLYVVTYWNQEFAYKPFSEVFMIQRGGLVYYGGLFGSVAAGIIYCQVRKLPMWKVGDILAPGIALGYMFGRIGCLLNGCCYGEVCHLPWAIHFPLDHPTHGESVHPTQIYDSLLNLVLYIVLAWMFRRRKFDGQVFASYLMLYAVTRSFVEMFRGDYPPDHIHSGLTSAHLVSIGIFAAGVVLFFWLRQPQKTEQK